MSELCETCETCGEELDDLAVGEELFPFCKRCACEAMGVSLDIEESDGDDNF